MSPSRRQRKARSRPQTALRRWRTAAAVCPEGSAVTTDPLGADNRLVVADVSRLGELAGCTVDARMGFLYITDASGAVRVYDSTLAEVTEALAGAQQLSGAGRAGARGI